MPTYEYVCDSCDLELEVEQSMKDKPLSVCPNCAGVLRRIFSPNSIIFKGNGFYSTDTRPACAKPEESQGASCATCPGATQTPTSS